MKTKKLLIIGFASLFMTFMLSRCTGDFEELNTNPWALSELDANSIGNMYAFCQYRGFYVNYHQVSQNLFGDHYCQFIANTQKAFPSDRYVLVGGWLNIAWRQFYGTIPNNLSEVLDLTDPAEHPELESMHALAQILKVILYERIANYWGPIPYSQVNNGEATVPYDAQKDIYMDFFATLDNALGILERHRGENAFGANDQIYGGDIDKWIKFGNTLRLRIAMRVSDVDPATAKTEAEKAVAGGVLTSWEDDAQLHTTPNSFNGMNRYTPWNEFRMSAAMESVMNGYEDPRRPGFFMPTRASYDENYVDYNGGPPEWIGLRNGYPIVDLQGDPDLDYNKLSAIGPRWFDVSLKDSNPWDIMHASEAYFLRAEGALKGWNMGATAKELYNDGIRNSMKFWANGLMFGGATITDAQIDAYINSTNVPIATHDAPTPVSDIPVKFDEGNPDVAREQILTQKWLSLFPDGWEGWADVRRADLPKMYPRIVSENPDVGPDELMRRVTFVSGEYDTNGDAVQDAISKLGGPDKGSTRLWWDPAN